MFTATDYQGILVLLQRVQFQGLDEAKAVSVLASKLEAAVKQAQADTTPAPSNE